MNELDREALMMEMTAIQMALQIAKDKGEKQ